MPGRITDILVDDSRTLLVVLEVFQALSSRDELYGVPVLNIKFKFNVQHDCELPNATLVGDIIAPIPLFLNRQEKHYELAAQLREMQSTRLEKRRAAAAAKRKRSEGDDGENEVRPMKKKKGPVRRKVTKVAPGESMVANRSKRKITRSKKALATPPESEEEIVSGSSDDSEMEDVLSNLDSEYSGSE
ncbi:hypothetical protein B0H19DRAFT_1081132 [Mycena capillaripes]|nr:hypothetical protein B0H19DRAFT_1081132 [Mycena capillaripes]